MKMSPRSRGGIGPTSNPMKVNRKSGAVEFSSRDPAHGAPSTNAPSYYQRNERWKQNLSEENFKELLWCVLMQYHQGEKINYTIGPELVSKIGCPTTLGISDLRWLQRQEGYDYISKQVHSKYLEDHVLR